MGKLSPFVPANAGTQSTHHRLLILSLSGFQAGSRALPQPQLSLRGFTSF
jgi:hypothetical protein